MTPERKASIKAEIEKLCSEGQGIQIANAFRISSEAERKKLEKKSREIYEKLAEKFPLGTSYQNWYSRALPVVKQVAPERLKEFEELYRVEKRKNIDVTTYGISDYLQGITTTYYGEKREYHTTFSSKFEQQINILKSISHRIDSLLVDIKGLLQSDLFDDEIGVAKELLRNGYVRAAGVVVGVVIERHLRAVLDGRGLKIAKKNSSISDFNDNMKQNGVIDLPEWRRIQRLADLRNICAHSKEREPTKDEAEELIEGAARVIKSVF